MLTLIDDFCKLLSHRADVGSVVIVFEQYVKLACNDCDAAV